MRIFNEIASSRKMKMRGRGSQQGGAEVMLDRWTEDDVIFETFVNKYVINLTLYIDIIWRQLMLFYGIISNGAHGFHL